MQSPGAWLSAKTATSATARLWTAPRSMTVQRRKKRVTIFDVVTDHCGHRTEVAINLHEGAANGIFKDKLSSN